VLPIGPGWTCEILMVEGDVVGEDGKMMTEEMELWRHDPIECMKELIGNPAFKNFMSYVPK